MANSFYFFLDSFLGGVFSIIFLIIITLFKVAVASFCSLIGVAVTGFLMSLIVSCIIFPLRKKPFRMEKYLMWGLLFYVIYSFLTFAFVFGDINPNYPFWWFLSIVFFGRCGLIFLVFGFSSNRLIRQGILYDTSSDASTEKEKLKRAGYILYKKENKHLLRKMNKEAEENECYKYICDNCKTVFHGWERICPSCGFSGRLRHGLDSEIEMWNTPSVGIQQTDI